MELNIKKCINSLTLSQYRIYGIFRHKYLLRKVSYFLIHKIRLKNDPSEHAEDAG